MAYNKEALDDLIFVEAVSLGCEPVLVDEHWRCPCLNQHHTVSGLNNLITASQLARQGSVVFQSPRWKALVHEWLQ